MLWRYDPVRADWYPLLRSGMGIEGRILETTDADELGQGYSGGTGGSDGEGQSLNDSGSLAIGLEFQDGTKGVFLVRHAWPGDHDENGEVDINDFHAMQECFGAAEHAVEPACEVFDFDDDDDVDWNDAQVFQLAFTSIPR